MIFGDHDAVLVDTFTTIEQNERLIEWVKAHERNLTHIYLTHGHGDHIYGIGQLLQAFPGAQAVATTGTIAVARLQASEEYHDGFWGRLFPGQIPQPVIPAELTATPSGLRRTNCASSRRGTPTPRGRQRCGARACG